eukprot:7386124-Prymnesium_polylepis.1
MNDMLAISSELPRRGDELGLLVLVKAGMRPGQLRAFSADRRKVQAALEGLCFGVPDGGLAAPPDGAAGWTCYDGPDQRAKPLRGRWFATRPNRYYADVVISSSRLQRVPAAGGLVPNIPTHESARAAQQEQEEEEEQGPAPAQFDMPAAVQNDQSEHHTGIVCPTDSLDAAAEVRKL